jgi:hypothetical protein
MTHIGVRRIYYVDIYKSNNASNNHPTTNPIMNLTSKTIATTSCTWCTHNTHNYNKVNIVLYNEVLVGGTTSKATTRTATGKRKKRQATLVVSRTELCCVQYAVVVRSYKIICNSKLTCAFVSFSYIIRVFTKVAITFHIHCQHIIMLHLRTLHTKYLYYVNCRHL